jgi:acetyltransferase-like isoleucine patch superfamily enzyme
VDIKPKLQPAVHAHRPIVPDPPGEIARAAELRRTRTREEILEMLDDCAHGSTEADAAMRRMLWRALVKRMGHGVRIGRGVHFQHPETFEIGDGVFIGDQAIIQGRFDGYCILGKCCWIGPQTYLDARAFEMEEYSGTGPAVKVLCCEHSGVPVREPFMSTELVTRPVLIQRGASIGIGTVVLPGVTIGEGAVVGVNSVVNKDVPAYGIATGMPARVLRYRRPKEGPGA